MLVVKGDSEGFGLTLRRLLAEDAARPPGVFVPRPDFPLGSVVQFLEGDLDTTWWPRSPQAKPADATVLTMPRAWVRACTVPMGILSGILTAPREIIGLYLDEGFSLTRVLSHVGVTQRVTG